MKQQVIKWGSCEQERRTCIADHEQDAMLRVSCCGTAAHTFSGFLQPGWKQVYDGLPANDKVAFAEVNCRESRELMQKHQAGQGGWPTLKYFNKDTGLAGAKYQQQTDKRVCDEMKDPVMVPPLSASSVLRMPSDRVRRRFRRSLSSSRFISREPIHDVLPLT